MDYDSIVQPLKEAAAKVSSFNDFVNLAIEIQNHLSELFLCDAQFEDVTGIRCGIARRIEKVENEGHSRPWAEEAEILLCDIAGIY